MQDYWNDPPEQDEPPECCGEMMDVDDNGACICATCGKRIEPQVDPDPYEAHFPELPDEEVK